MTQILKEDLKSPSKFNKKFKDYILSLKDFVLNEYKIVFNEEEIGDLLLSICRVDELNNKFNDEFENKNKFGVIYKRDNKMFLNKENVEKWIKEKLIPSTVILRLDNEDIIRLLIFCIEITYQMFSGGTKATITQKGFRERRRSFESILVDQFVGKLGEIFVKKYLEQNFSINVELDWEISTQIEKYKNDIINANKKVSIKSSPNLAGIWAEADIGYEYGIMVKCSVPQQPILQFFTEACGFSKLLNFAENKIPSEDLIFKNYLGKLRERIEKYRCGEIQTVLKGFICGYFKTSEHSPIKKDTKLEYLGNVREERFLLPISCLKWTQNEWKLFLKETGLLNE